MSSPKRALEAFWIVHVCSDDFGPEARQLLCLRAAGVSGDRTGNEASIGIALDGSHETAPLRAGCPDNCNHLPSAALFHHHLQLFQD
jgi:hypothetical protein